MIITNCFDFIITISLFFITSGQQRSKTDKTRNTTMKSIKTFVAIAALSLISFGSFAQSISASASTLDRAEAKIAAQAAEQGALQNHQRSVQ
jgi:hypothetical protein